MIINNFEKNDIDRNISQMEQGQNSVMSLILTYKVTIFVCIHNE